MGISICIGLAGCSGQADELAIAQADLVQLAGEVSDARATAQAHEEQETALQLENSALSTQVALSAAEIDELQHRPTPEPVYIPIENENRASRPYCVGGTPADELRQQIVAGNQLDGESANGFIGDPAVHAIWNQAFFLHQVCYSDRGEMAFVAFGEFDAFPEANNAIGLYTTDQDLLVEYIFNRNSGDYGVCMITGYIERNLVFSCGGGDGPGGWNTVYVFNRSSGEAAIIKQCSFIQDERECEINLLELGEYPF